MNGLTIYSDEELKKIQALELSALKELITICDRLSIPYFLIDGAAIGAVRHHGFIPWDDDIDVGMLRKDYQRFLKEAPQYLSDKYYLQTPYTGKSNPYFYSKLRINNTQFVEYCNHRLNIHHGVYIDICPFDEVPDDETLNARQFRRCQRWIRLFVVRQSPDRSQPPVGLMQTCLAAARRMLHYWLKLVPYSVFANAIERETTAYNDTGQKAVAFLHYPKRKVDYMLKTELAETVDCRFEETVVKIPCGYDDYLKRHYGDYMAYPEPSMRFGHKPYRFSIDEQLFSSASE